MTEYVSIAPRLECWRLEVHVQHFWYRNERLLWCDGLSVAIPAGAYPAASGVVL